LRFAFAHNLFIESEDPKIGDTISSREIWLPTEMYYGKNLTVFENKATFTNIFKEEEKGIFKNKYIYEYELEKNIYQSAKKFGTISEPKDDDEKQTGELFEQMLDQDCAITYSEDHIFRSMHIGPVLMEFITNEGQKKAFNANSGLFDIIRKGIVTDEDLELEI